MRDEWFDKIRKLTEECDMLEGFLITHSVGGGTGSGLTVNMLQKLNESFNKKPRINFTVYPSIGYGGVVEPYNAVLSTHHLL